MHTDQIKHILSDCLITSMAREEFLSYIGEKYSSGTASKLGQLNEQDFVDTVLGSNVMCGPDAQSLEFSRDAIYFALNTIRKYHQSLEIDS